MTCICSVRIGVQKDNNNNNNNDQHKSSVVAIKMVSKTGEKEELDKLLRFKKEILIHYSLGKHQNIIQAFMASEDDQGMYLAMEYAMAGELFDRIGKITWV